MFYYNWFYYNNWFNKKILLLMWHAAEREALQEETSPSEEETSSSARPRGPTTRSLPLRREEARVRGRKERRWECEGGEREIGRQRRKGRESIQRARAHTRWSERQGRCTGG